MIVRADATHFDDLFALIEQMVKESVFAYATPCRAKIWQLFHHPKTAVFMAYRHHRCIGFAGVVISPFFFSQVERANDVGFYILPEHRGGSAVLGLLRAVEKWAKEMGSDRLYVGHSVGGKTDEVRHFYERQGYKTGGFNCVKVFKD